MKSCHLQQMARTRKRACFNWTQKDSTTYYIFIYLHIYYYIKIHLKIEECLLGTRMYRFGGCTLNTCMEKAYLTLLWYTLNMY